MKDPPGRDELEAGLKFLHLFSMLSREELIGVAARMHALIEALIARGVVSADELEQGVQSYGQKRAETMKSEVMVNVTPIDDKYQLAELPVIDCESRLSLCQARCCSFVFHLSMQDLDEGIVRWNYSAPYQIAQNHGNRCFHQTAEGPCSIYDKRPAVCRTYDCRTDPRVWLDFDKRVPAPVASDLVPLAALVRR